MRAKKICSHPLCHELQPCETHQRKPWEGSRRNTLATVKGANGTKRRRYLLDRDNFTCAQCEQVNLAANLQVDHIIPLSENGPDTLENCQLLCLECHGQKSQSEAARSRRLNQ